MTRWRDWAPILACAVIVMLLVALQARTSVTPVVMAPLPGPVHVARQYVPELRIESGRPLFQPSRSNAPIGQAADAAPPTPPPALAGVVIGGGRAVALVKGSSGETVVLHVGEVADGWTLASIAPRKVVFAKDGTSETVEMLFEKPRDGPPTASASTGSAAAPSAKLPLAPPDAGEPK